MKQNLVPKSIVLLFSILITSLLMGACDADQEAVENDYMPVDQYIEKQLNLHTHSDYSPNKRQVEAKLLAFNDFHGQLDEGVYVAGRPVGSAPVLASYLKEAALGKEYATFIVSAGDLVGASMPVSALLQDEPTIMFFNMLGNKHANAPWKKLHPHNNLVAIPGNHEFDEGQYELARLLYGGNHDNGPFLQETYQGLYAPMISANIVYERNGSPYLPPLVIKVVQGVPIAFIGADVQDTPSIVTKSGIEGLAFLDEAASINKYVNMLQRFNIHAIIAIIHEGASQTSYSGATDESQGLPAGNLIDIVTRLDDDVDIVIGGHTHGFCNALVPNQHNKKMLISQSWSKGSAFADIDLVLERTSNDIITKSARIITTWADSGAGLTPDQQVAALVRDANAIVAPRTEQVITTAASDITREQNEAGESALGNLIADAQRAITGTDFAFMNPGGIRDDIYAGDVTWGELYTVQPFNNYLVTMELTGQQIYDLLNQQWYEQPYPRILQVSGLSYIWDAARSENDRVVEVKNSEGQPLEQDAVYSVTVNSFIAEGGDNFTILTEGSNRETGMIDLDALLLYLQSLNTPVSAHIEGRINVPQ